MLDVIARLRQGAPPLLDVDDGFVRLSEIRTAPAGSDDNEHNDADIVIRLLGPFRLGSLDETVTPLPLRPQHLAVLESLALRAAQWVPRDRLLEWFWPATDPRVGTKRLSTAVSAIRKVLDQHAPGSELQRRSESYRLVPSGQTDLAYVVSQLRTAETHMGRDVRAGLEALGRALEFSGEPLLPSAVTADWASEVRWDFSDRWERAVSAALEASSEQPSEELLQMLPRLLARITGSDRIWRRAVAVADQAGAPLLANQLEDRYQHLLERPDKGLRSPEH